MTLFKRTTVALLLTLMAPMTWASPEVGQEAPDFNLMGSDGRTYSLSDFRGKEHVVIAFFPKAFTGG